MEKLTIGQLAKRVGLRTSALRYYEEQGLLEPASRTEAGYRLYGAEAEQRLRFIQRAQRLGFSLADIQILLAGWQAGNLSDEMIIKTAQERYLALERQVTQLLVLQHELELFLQDMQREARHLDRSGDSLFKRLIDQVCASPLNQPAETMLDWMMEYTGCILTSSEAQGLLDRLRGQHVHIWQEEEGYHILVVSDDPAVGQALAALAQLEANCQAHAHTDQAPEFSHQQEGYLLIARGAHDFIFARLFLALERERKT
jgi:DNA-binding transcriptional MerR regulator